MRDGSVGPVDFRPTENVSRIHRGIFSDERIFDLEMKHLFEGGWVFLALDSQIPNSHDFLVTRVGRHEILLMRDKQGEIGAFYNTCPHRGAQICSLRQGNSPLHVCPYHSWSFDSSGRNRAIKAKSSGAYSPAFLQQSHDLHPIARLESYRGFLFGSLREDVGSLDTYLGEVRKILDLALHQGDEGLEVLPGMVTYTYRANWKLQLENSADGYHVTSTHPTYMKIAEARASEDADRTGVGGVWDRANVLTEESEDWSRGGSFGFANGHALAWGSVPIVPSHPLFEKRFELEKRLGREKSEWMFYFRNLTIFPNVQLADNLASILRIIRPIAPNLTEMVSYCIAPKGESDAGRRRRLRQFEDFFNPSGLATPDDLVAYEGCQNGHGIRGASGWLQGYERGLSARTNGPSKGARELGVNPLHSVEGSGLLNDETIFQTHYQAWSERLGDEISPLLDMVENDAD